MEAGSKKRHVEATVYKLVALLSRLNITMIVPIHVPREHPLLVISDRGIKDYCIESQCEKCSGAQPWKY